ncbi:MAG TPA: primosomal protein N' [Gemmatimonadaceae bacterium]|nr:primosomal protein N' [Gemmatimonadaceae bacterium]
MPTSARRLIEVALPLPLFRSFTYALDGASGHPVQPGSRVVVPVRGRKELGIALGEADASSLRGATAKSIVEVPDAEPAVGAGMLALARWMSEYYVAPIGVVLRSMLPAALTGAGAPTPSQKTRRVVTIGREIPSLVHRDRIFARAPQQRTLYELLESMGGRSAVEHLLEQLRFSPSVLKGLVARGLVEVSDEVVVRDPFAGRDGVPSATPVPTPAQQVALDAMAASGPGETFLLRGITGSGKTLVYIELLRRVVEEQGRTAIVLVPEIALTPQTVHRFRAVFGDKVAVLHSALSDGERYDAWLALKRGEKRIAVGARSAIFAPLENLGAIVVDEEHEASYKQGEAPRYHAREVAVMRGRLEGATVLLGSATPSLESWVNARAGKYHLLTLENRVGGGRLPTVAVVDMRGARELERAGEGKGAANGGQGTVGAASSGSGLDGGVERRGGARGAPPEPHDRLSGLARPHHSTATPSLAAPLPSSVLAAHRAVLSEELDDALHGCLARGEQSILLLNRRGYASFVQCADCGDVATCPDCSITLTYHRTTERLCCHYCLYQEHPRPDCRRCGGRSLRRRGIGTQQVERLLAERFPTARVARMDVDTTGAKWAHAEILDRVGRGEVDILLGTQMIAKGLDFPNVTVVGVIDADVGINLPDFRASERCFQLLSQVAGRAGRGPKGGHVLIQTRVPTHHAVRCAITHDYLGFVDAELPGRSDPPYPPTVRLANVVFSGLQEQAVQELAEEGARWLRELVKAHADGQITLLGPAPCAVERIKTRWRWHVLLKASSASALSRVSRYFLQRFAIPASHQMRVTVDRDPVSLL